MLIIGIDTGGTFTDFVYWDGSAWGIYKIMSTPADPAEAVLAGLRHIAGRAPKQLVHGSTVATNALLERKGAATAIIANRGFEDLIEIGRQNRTRLYDLAYRREPSIVPEDLRFGVKGRVLSTGEILEELDEDDLRSLAAKVKASNASSVAVCLLFSYLNPVHEKTVGELFRDTSLHVSLSHEIVPEFREYERTSTTVINAYVSPKVKDYIGRLRDSLRTRDSLRIMQSNGGSISAETAMRESVRTILSGPAGGAVGALHLGKLAGCQKLISFDMGGTSTDVSLIDGGLTLTLEASLAGHPLKTPMIDIHTVGAGGGSIAFVDRGGALKVGPQSAGADPGPDCYGRGGEITVTDANLYLGRLVPEHFLGGRMQLAVDRLDEAMGRLAARVGLSKVELAEGVLAVANTTMERAIRVISVERGFDPREFTLFAFGGAGGMHAAYLARCLDIQRVLVPPNPGILSAIGMLMADVVKDYSLTVMLAATEVDWTALKALFQPLERKGVKELIGEGLTAEAISLERFLDMRYQGQSYEIIVPFDEDYAQRFHRLHRQQYGYADDGKPIEIVNLRLRARGVPNKPAFAATGRKSTVVGKEAYLGVKEVVFDHQPMQTDILDREKLSAGNRLRGPAILVEYSSTLVLPPFVEGFVDYFGNVVMELD